MCLYICIYVKYTYSVKSQEVNNIQGSVVFEIFKKGGRKPKCKEIKFGSGELLVKCCLSCKDYC